MKLITSRDNPVYKKLLKLAEDARECRKQGRTLIDGPHLVAAYRQQVGLPELLLVSESGYKHPEVLSLIAGHDGGEITLLKDVLFKSLSGVESPVGIAAVICIPAETNALAHASCVLLDAVQDAGNVGSIMRSTAAAGITDVFAGPGCASAWSPRVMRAAQGAHFRLCIRESANLAEILSTYQGVSLATVARSGTPLTDLHLPENIAWIFGNEGHGVSPTLVSLASLSVTIPMASDTESLNVAAAAAICLFASLARHQPAGR